MAPPHHASVAGAAIVSISGAATSVVVGVVAIVDASVAGAAIVSISVAVVVAGAIDVGFSTLIYLIASAPSTPLVCPVQT